MLGGVKGASSTKPTGISSGKSTSSSSSNSSKGTGKYTGGRTQKELDDLAGDPSHGGKIRDQGLKEREIGLDLEQQGKLGRLYVIHKAMVGQNLLIQQIILNGTLKASSLIRMVIHHLRKGHLQ